MQLSIIKFISVIIDHLEKKNFKYIQNLLKLKDFIKWNFVLRYILSNFLPLQFALFLQFYGNFQDPYSSIGIVLSGINLILSFWLMKFLLDINLKAKILRSRLDRLKSYETVFQDFNPHTKIHFHINIALILQRMTFAFSIVLLYHYPLANLILLNLQCIPMVYLLVKYMPYKRKSMNYVGIVQFTAQIVIHTVLMCVRWTSSLDDDQLVLIGWGLIAITSAALSVNLFVVFHMLFYSFKEIYLSFKQFRARRQLEKRVSKKFQNQLKSKKIPSKS